MGMFTSVYIPHPAKPDKELEIQFKCGHDDCDQYRVGDTVDFRVLSRPGEAKLADGVYDGESGEGRFPNWVTTFWCVVIKDHAVHEVKQFEPANFECLGDQIESLRVYHDLRREDDYPREWWSEEAWAAKEAEDVANKQRWEAKRLAWCQKRGVDPNNMQAADHVGLFASIKMEEDGFYRQIMPPVPVT